ncbi:GNAT family acetyltransferase [soil metagenome]
MIAFRPIEDRDIGSVIALWSDCSLTRAWNDPHTDIAFARGKENSDILVGIVENAIAASVMVGHDGHRGMLYYVAVAPRFQDQGLGKLAVREAEAWLKARGVWKINILVRSENAKVRGFYEKLGYEIGDVWCMGRRILEE